MSVPGPDPVPDHFGHRARLRQRLIDGGGDALLDYELIEQLLALSIPRRDTKPLAKALLKEFDSIGGLLTASPEALARVKGIGDVSIAAIKVAHAIAVRMLRAEVDQRPVLANWQALIDYLRTEMAHQPVERVRVLHLNTRNVLIRDELISTGSIDEAAVHVREVMRRAIDFGSTALILVHNHPSGDPQPSRADIDLTRNIIEAGRRLGVTVHDHIIIGTNGHVSLRAQGLI
ncbi:MAG: DNA repair protein RadC [Sphingomonas sp.]